MELFCPSEVKGRNVRLPLIWNQCLALGHLKTQAFSAACWHSFCSVGVNKRATETVTRLLAEKQNKRWKEGGDNVGKKKQCRDFCSETRGSSCSPSAMAEVGKEETWFSGISKVVAQQSPGPKVIWIFHILTHLHFMSPKSCSSVFSFFSPLIWIKLTVGSQPWWTGRVFSINKRSGFWSRMSGACPHLIQMFSLPSCDVILGMWHEDTFSCYNINMFRSVAVKVTKLFLIQTCHLEPGISSFCAGSGARCCCIPPFRCQITWVPSCFPATPLHFKPPIFVSLTRSGNRCIYLVLSPLIALLVEKCLLYLYDEESQGKKHRARFFYLFIQRWLQEVD